MVGEGSASVVNHQHLERGCSFVKVGVAVREVIVRSLCPEFGPLIRLLLNRGLKPGRCGVNGWLGFAAGSLNHGFGIIHAVQRRYEHGTVVIFDGTSKVLVLDDLIGVILIDLPTCAP